MCINDCCQFSKNLINYNVSFILITKSHSSGIFFRVSNLVADIRYFRRIWIGMAGNLLIYNYLFAKELLCCQQFIQVQFIRELKILICRFTRIRYRNTYSPSSFWNILLKIKPPADLLLHTFFFILTEQRQKKEKVLTLLHGIKKYTIMIWNVIEKIFCQKRALRSVVSNEIKW